MEKSKDEGWGKEESITTGIPLSRDVAPDVVDNTLRHVPDQGSEHPGLDNSGTDGTHGRWSVPVPALLLTSLHVLLAF
ncbi:unnamed protein product [Merluccius merluccius]